MRVRLRRERLLSLLAASNLSQNHWAIRLGLSRGHWSDIVNGRHPYPSARTRERMLEAFGVPLADLFEVEDGASGGDELDFRRAIATRYSLIRELGRGGMGTVFLALDQRHGRQVALKVVSPEAAGGIGTEELLKEIALVARLQHPNILPLFDSGEAAGHPWYVMPFIRGGSLRERMGRDGRLTPIEALPLVEGIAAALEYAHGERILHCDVKPENILLDGRHPFVMDFGIARKLHSEADEWLGLRKGLDFSAGTPAYVSPEQASGEAVLDPRSDVYSLACVVYELLAGRPPFEGTTTREIVTRRFRAPPPDLRAWAVGVPGGVVEVLERAMSLDRDRRPAGPVALAEELRRGVLRGGKTMVVPPGVQRAARNVVRAARGTRLAAAMRGLLQDVRYVTRGLARTPRFSLGVVGSLALGLGLGLPAFSLADRLFLRPPAHIRDPDRVLSLVIRVHRPEGPVYSPGISGMDYTAISTLANTLEGAAAWAPWRPSLGRGAEAREIAAQGVTASFFRVLGVQPHRGRFFEESEDLLGASSGPCVISYAFWRREFGGDPSALGRVLQLGSGYYTVVGIAPEGFSGLNLGRVDVWAPIHVALGDMQGGGSELFTTDRSWWVRIVGRLRPGVTHAAADADAARVYRIAGPRIRDADLEWTYQWQSILPGRALSRSSAANVPLWLAGGAALLLLLLAANLAHLFLARNIGRSRELAIRFAIGGGRARVLRLMLAEALVLSAVSAAAALALSSPATGMIRRLLYPGLTWSQPALDVRIAAAAGVAALVLGGLVALGTTLYAARLDPALALKSGAHQVAGGSGRRLRLVLVACQATVFTALVLASAAFVKSLDRATSVPLGFDVENLLVAQSPLSVAGYGREQREQYYALALESARALPGVTSASIGYATPWFSNWFEVLKVPGRTEELPRASFDVGTPDGLRTLGLTLRAGRWIEPGDQAGSEPVVVVNETFARSVWPGENPLLQCVRVGADSMPCRAVVGVVGDHRFTGRLTDPMTPAYWVPVPQARGYNYSHKLFVRYDPARGNPAGGLARMLQGLAPNLPAADVHPAKREYEALFPSLKMGATMFSAFGALAVLIGALGLFSTMSYLVTERRKEFVIRSALGAEPRQVLVPVLIGGVAVIAVGVFGGLALAVLARARLDPLLFQTTLLESGSLVLAVALALAAGALAAWGPARQAALANPAAALQEQ